MSFYWKREHILEDFLKAGEAGQSFDEDYMSETEYEEGYYSETEEVEVEEVEEVDEAFAESEMEKVERELAELEERENVEAKEAAKKEAEKLARWAKTKPLGVWELRMVKKEGLAVFKKAAKIGAVKTAKLTMVHEILRRICSGKPVTPAPTEEEMAQVYAELCWQDFLAYRRAVCMEAVKTAVEWVEKKRLRKQFEEDAAKAKVEEEKRQAKEAEEQAKKNAIEMAKYKEDRARAKASRDRTGKSYKSKGRRYCKGMETEETPDPKGGYFLRFPCCKKSRCAKDCGERKQMEKIWVPFRLLQHDEKVLCKANPEKYTTPPKKITGSADASEVFAKMEEQKKKRMELEKKELEKKEQTERRFDTAAIEAEAKTRKKGDSLVEKKVEFYSTAPTISSEEDEEEEQIDEKTKKLLLSKARDYKPKKKMVTVEEDDMEKEKEEEEEDLLFLLALRDSGRAKEIRDERKLNKQRKMEKAKAKRERRKKKADEEAKKKEIAKQALLDKNDKALELMNSMFVSANKAVRKRRALEFSKDKEAQAKELKFTKMCRFVENGKRCRHPKGKCRFAHSISELRLANCKHGDLCICVSLQLDGTYVNTKTKHGLCLRLHPGETREMVEVRTGDGNKKKAVMEKKVATKYVFVPTPTMSSADSKPGTWASIVGTKKAIVVVDEKKEAEKEAKLSAFLLRKTMDKAILMAARTARQLRKQKKMEKAKKEAQKEKELRRKMFDEAKAIVSKIVVEEQEQPSFSTFASFGRRQQKTHIVEVPQRLAGRVKGMLERKGINYRLRIVKEETEEEVVVEKTFEEKVADKIAVWKMSRPEVVAPTPAPVEEKEVEEKEVEKELETIPEELEEDFVEAVGEWLEENGDISVEEELWLEENSDPVSDEEFEELKKEMDALRNFDKEALQALRDGRAYIPEDSEGDEIIYYPTPPPPSPAEKERKRGTKRKAEEKENETAKKLKQGQEEQEEVVIRVPFEMAAMAHRAVIAQGLKNYRFVIEYNGVPHKPL